MEIIYKGIIYISILGRVETTVLDESQVRPKRDIESTKNQQQIDELLDYFNHPAERGYDPLGLLNAFFGTFTSTIVLPVSYALDTSVFTKQVTLGSSSQLLCLPSGYLIC